MSYHVGDFVLFNAGGMWNPDKPEFVCEILDEKVSAYDRGPDSFLLKPITPVPCSLSSIMSNALPDDTFWCWHGYFAATDFQPEVTVDISALL